MDEAYIFCLSFEQAADNEGNHLLGDFWHQVGRLCWSNDINRSEWAPFYANEAFKAANKLNKNKS